VTPAAGVSGRVQQVTEETRPATYAALVERCAPALLRLALMLTGDPSDAEDLLQAALLRCVRHGDRIVVMEAPAAYLRRVMLNEHTSRGRALRRRIRTVSTPYASPEPATESAAGEVDHRDETWRWLAMLPPKQRAVLVLRFYEDLPDAEIAAILSCSEGTVRSNASRGLASLRTRLLEGNPQ
jgi:RNA polymerase sigma-70 factor (sigma-E family)